MTRRPQQAPVRPGCQAAGCYVSILAIVLVITATGATKADTPDPDALYQQARIYERGDGVARDPARAATLYCRAARDGNWKAAYNVGWMRLEAPDGWFRPTFFSDGETAAKRLRIGPRPDAAGRGRCRRRDAPGTTAGLSAAPPDIIALVDELAPRFDVEPRLVLSMMAVESAFRADAVSPKNAQGLMQLIPQTARRFGVVDPFNARQNVEGGMRYLRWLLDHFAGNMSLALAGYNAGEQAVRKYGGIPPYRETRAYVKEVLRLYEQAPVPLQPDTKVVSLPRTETNAREATGTSTPKAKPPSEVVAPHACYKVSAHKIVRPC